MAILIALNNSLLSQIRIVQDSGNFYSCKIRFNSKEIALEVLAYMHNTQIG